jgi:hypothetical protein
MMPMLLDDLAGMPVWFSTSEDDGKKITNDWGQSDEKVLQAL